MGDYFGQLRYIMHIRTYRTMCSARLFSAFLLLLLNIVPNIPADLQAHIERKDLVSVMSLFVDLVHSYPQNADIFDKFDILYFYALLPFISRI